jgi:hypothetical protein
MITATPWIRISPDRARLLRRDTAEILTRLYFLERSLIVSQAGWIPTVATLDAKFTLARALWQDAVSANELRDRVFELRYPSRVIVPDKHRALIALFDGARCAPTAEAFFLGLVRVLRPALRDAFGAFYDLADGLTDGPSKYLLKHSLADKEELLAALEPLAEDMLAAQPEARAEAETWAVELARRAAALGPNLLEAPGEQGDAGPLPNSRPFVVAEIPGRDPRFQCTRFNWPHVFDPAFPTGEGVALQVRSAVSHVNEVWAMEICAANLFHFADQLDWEYIYDVARWTYDEGRHCMMGYQRLKEYGLSESDVPLGNYLYVVARSGDPIWGLAVLFHQETKFIHRTRERIGTFERGEDRLSRHDQEFDWADETFHAEYGKRWLSVLLPRRTELPRTFAEIHPECDARIDRMVATISEAEKQQLYTLAGKLLRQAKSLATAHS